MILFDGKHSSHADFGIKSVTVVSRPLLTGTRDRGIAIPGRDGVWDLSPDLEPADIRVRIFFKAPSHEQLRTHIRNMAAWLSPRGVKPLIFADEMDKQYMARRSNEIRPEEIMAQGFADISFFVPSVYAESVSPKTTGNSGINGGTVGTPCLITCTMAGNAASLTVTRSGGVFLRLITPLVAGDVVVFDTETRKVTLNGQLAQKWLDVESTWFKLPPGAFSLSLSPTGTVVVTFRERWL